MKRVMFDTETTGLIKQALPVSHPSQPHLVQLGIILFEDDGKEIASADLIIRPVGFEIPKEASNIHGVTQELAMQVGVPLATAMSVFSQLRANCEEILAYNMEFDDKIMQIAFERLGRKPTGSGPKLKTCAMRMATPIVKLPPTQRMIDVGRGNQYKPPNLTEAYKFFFGRGFEGAHSAIDDARAAKEVYVEMKRLTSNG